MSASSRPFVVTGRIATVAGAADARAMLVREGRVAEVGDSRIADQAADAGIEVHSFGERLIVPGFVDPHIHLRHLATGRGRGVDCRFPHCVSIADVLDALRDGLANVSAGDWLIGYGNLFFDQKIADRRVPTRAELDQVSDRVPIVLHMGGHSSVLNTPALRLAGVERFLSGAAGGWGAPIVDVDEHGEPTGLVAEIDPMLPIPEPDTAETEQYVAQTYAELFTRYGVTTIGEMVERLDTADLLSGLIGSGRMPARAVLYLMVPAALPLHDAVEWASGHRTISDRVSVAGLKMFADGGYSSRNAASKTPYAVDHAPHPGYHGVLNLTYPSLRTALEATRAADLQLAVHTNGTAAQEEVLTAVLGAGDPMGHPAVRIEHLGNVLADPADIATWRRAGVRPVLQPAFLHNFVGDFVPMLLGDAGTRGRLPLRSILDGGVIPAGSSDVALGAEDQQSNPLFGIWCLLARRSYWQRHIEPSEAITFSEALRLFTLEGARALGLADEIGSLEPGKRADFVVFDRDPRAHADDLLRTSVDAVYLDGAPLPTR
ncbi:amidohydrolase family protein [Nocardioides sp. BP30]|uniref:amidohydrolase n=1 Tax=Nocardioides sp. BP30 TaxID=3036374 RepID=UPI002468F4D4|nr:amidohydrolase family protein [Nocardioides sp. BP30]WGL51684.1 amidohydrolase family protein [Nocardioides sp. BP30]